MFQITHTFDQKNTPPIPLSSISKTIVNSIVVATTKYLNPTQRTEVLLFGAMSDFVFDMVVGIISMTMGFGSAVSFKC